MIIPSTISLRCLDASARLLSFTRAAAELHLTQSAVSHHILALERQLGTPLFLRHRAGLSLTTAGRAYWTETAAALRLVERATENIIATGGSGGTLNLSVSSSLANLWLMPRLHSFVTGNPDITLNLSTRVGPVDFSSHQEDASIDFCIGAEPGIEAQLVMPLVLRPYGAPSLLAPGASGMPDGDVLADLLRTHALIRRTTVMEAWPGWLRQAGLDAAIPESHLAAGPRYALLSMALHGAIGGLGIALLPDYAARHAIRNGQLACLSDCSWHAPRAYYLRWPAAHAAKEPVKRFAAWLADTSRTDDIDAAP